MVRAAQGLNSIASGARGVSKRLVAAYVFDWILILATAALGGGFSYIHGSRHAFTLTDPTLSYPYYEDTISVGVLLIVSIVAPGIITALVCLFCVPRPASDQSIPKALIWRRKIWEWNVAWMGLGVALAGAFMLTEGLKDLAGKPRPNFLAVCNPDTSSEAIAKYRVGGLGTQLDSNLPIMVTSGICRNPSQSQLRNAFSSWPSGHSSFAWAGMLYLSLFLSAKFAVQIPLLTSSSSLPNRAYVPTFGKDNEKDLRGIGSRSRRDSSRADELVPPRNEAAAPPIYLLIIAFVPICVAFLISVSRFFDYKHHGFDIISGSLLGAFTAWFGFRWYHLPIRQGAGWAWGPRSRERAFWIGVGHPSYVGDEGWATAKMTRKDIENGHETTENGTSNRSSDPMDGAGRNIEEHPKITGGDQR